VQTIRSVLIDIDGVLCVGDVPLPGALAALDLLRQRGVGLRFVTNTTRRTRTDIVRDLGAMGFDIALHEVISGAIAARRIIEVRRLRPLLLVHPGLLPDFAGISTANPNAVLIGDAADGFSYHAMNTAFRVLVGVPGAPLIALANNRYFRASDGLALDAGPYVAALEYAAGVRAEITGKPAPAIFRTALDELQCAPGDALMIGDDIESDIGGALAAGLQAILVRTGKYRAADEMHPTVRPSTIADDFHRAVIDFVVPRLV
jgi:HAD superfamily hydrolase (TIGR01458 family)